LFVVYSSLYINVLSDIYYPQFFYSNLSFMDYTCTQTSDKNLPLDFYVGHLVLWNHSGNREAFWFGLHNKSTSSQSSFFLASLLCWLHVQPLLECSSTSPASSCRPLTPCRSPCGVYFLSGRKRERFRGRRSPLVG